MLNYRDTTACITAKGGKSGQLTHKQLRRDAQKEVKAEHLPFFLSSTVPKKAGAAPGHEL